jgi:hypothetical protein
MLSTKTLPTCAVALLLTATSAFAGDAGKAAPKNPVTPAPAPSPFIYDFELKARFEVRENNFDFNDANDALTDDSWLLYHARLGLGWQPTPWFKIYAQGQDAREFDSDRPNVPGVLGAEGDGSFVDVHCPHP